jgi:hypothetical protein
MTKTGAMEKDDAITRWKLVSPQAAKTAARERVNGHPPDLSGKTVVLYWNGKPNGDVFLSRVGELLRSRFPDLRVVRAWESKPLTRESDPTREASGMTAAEIAALGPDIVIGAAGDCVGSATWLVTDLLNVERLGIPTVTVVTEPFSEVAATLPFSEGFTEACFVAIPPPLGMLPSSVVERKAEGAFEETLKAVTVWQPGRDGAVQGGSPDLKSLDFAGTIEELNDLFLERGWSLGLPVLPPTRERVDALLAGTSRRGDEIIGRIPPQMRILTVELLAVYAAMAGCGPECMPVLVTAFDAFLQPEANLRLALSGSGTSQLIVIASGPVVQEVGLASGQGAAGKGHRANASIGYAINLVAYSVGGSRPPSMDRSTLGSPSDYVCWVFGENEEEVPKGWGTLRADEGFGRSESLVTVMASYPPIENMDHWSASADEHIRWWGHIVSPLHNMGGPAIPRLLEQRPIIALGPEHAALIVSSNWGKDDFQKAFWKSTRTSLSAWPAAAVAERLAETLGPVTADTLIPVTRRPEQILIVIAGGDGKQSHYFAPLPGSFPVSRVIGR